MDESPALVRLWSQLLGEKGGTLSRIGVLPVTKDELQLVYKVKARIPEDAASVAASWPRMTAAQRQSLVADQFTALRLPIESRATQAAAVLTTVAKLSKRGSELRKYLRRSLHDLKALSPYLHIRQLVVEVLWDSGLYSDDEFAPALPAPHHRGRALGSRPVLELPSAIVGPSDALVVATDADVGGEADAWRRDADVARGGGDGLGRESRTGGDWRYDIVPAHGATAHSSSGHVEAERLMVAAQRRHVYDAAHARGLRVRIVR